MFLLLLGIESLSYVVILYKAIVCLPQTLTLPFCNSPSHIPFCCIISPALAIVLVELSINSSGLSRLLQEVSLWSKFCQSDALSLESDSLAEGQWGWREKELIHHCLFTFYSLFLSQSCTHTSTFSSNIELYRIFLINPLIFIFLKQVSGSFVVCIHL